VSLFQRSSHGERAVARVFKTSKGVTLIELLIALVISSVLIAGLYRMFVSQQASYATQEQVTDMQQNVRVAINQMIREIRMAGFGGKNNNPAGQNDIITVFANVNGFGNIVNPVHSVTVDGITHDQITVLAAYDPIASLTADANAGVNAFTVKYDSGVKFNNDKKKYLCLNRSHCYLVDSEAGGTITLPMGTSLNENHTKGEPVFLIKAITYGMKMDNDGVTPILFRDENTGGGRQPVAENIENLQFHYVLADGTENDAPGDPTQIRGVRITITARTQRSDPQSKEPGGFLRRTINTYVDVRNLR
jgi:prepilin-type N-terminal cleavage/methylation domain-containing protein